MTVKDVFNKVKDMVNKPPHYANRKYEVIDVMKDTLSAPEFVGYCLGCVIKYITRWDKKGAGVEDLKKARWYLNKLIDTLEEEVK